jgi:hypothetical protein
MSDQITNLPISARYGVDPVGGEAEVSVQAPALASTPSPAARAAKGANKATAKSSAGAGAAKCDARGAVKQDKEQADDAGCAGGSDATGGDLIGAMEAA